MMPSARSPPRNAHTSPAINSGGKLSHYSRHGWPLETSTLYDGPRLYSNGRSDLIIDLHLPRHLNRHREAKRYRFVNWHALITLPLKSAWEVKLRCGVPNAKITPSSVHYRPAFGLAVSGLTALSNSGDLERSWLKRGDLELHGAVGQIAGRVGVNHARVARTSRRPTFDANVTGTGTSNVKEASGANVPVAHMVARSSAQAIAPSGSTNPYPRWRQTSLLQCSWCRLDVGSMIGRMKSSEPRQDAE